MPDNKEKYAKLQEVIEKHKGEKVRKAAGSDREAQG